MPTPPQDWNVPVTTVRGPNGLVAYLAGAGGAPRVQVWEGDRLAADLFAFEASQRGGVTGAWGPDGNLYVMAGPGGGPRLRAYTPAGGLVADRFVGDPSDRRGFVPVPVGVPVDRPVPVETVLPRLKWAAGDGYPLYVALETDRPAAWSVAVLTEAARLLTPLGMRVTTVRPDALPRTYGQAVVGPQSFVGSGGGFPGPTWDTPVSDYTARQVFVLDHPDPAVTGCGIAHEAGHAWGLPHAGDPVSVMYPSAHRDAEWQPVDVSIVRDRITHLRGR